MLGRQLQQLTGTGFGQLNITENDESADVEILIDGTEGQIAFAAGDVHRIMHGYSLLYFCIKKCRKYL